MHAWYIAICQHLLKAYSSWSALWELHAHLASYMVVVQHTGCVYNRVLLVRKGSYTYLTGMKDSIGNQLQFHLNLNHLRQAWTLENVSKVPHTRTRACARTHTHTHTVHAQAHIRAHSRARKGNTA